MSRDLSTDMINATEATVARPIALLSLAFPSGMVRAWTGYGVLVWGGFDWQGTGDLGEVSEIEEAVEVAAKGATLRLNGLPPDLVAAALTENYQGRAAVLYIGAMTAAGALVADPYAILSGRMDQIETQDQGESCALTITVENRLVDLNRNRERRLTDKDQRQDYPADRGFEFVNSLQSKQLLWGNSTVPNGDVVPPDDTGSSDAYN